MGLLSNLLFTQTGVGNAYDDPHTIYKDLLGDEGAVGGLTNVDLEQVLEAVAGSGGVADELSDGYDPVGLGHLLASDTLAGGILTDFFG